MAALQIGKIQQDPHEAMVSIPLSALRYISRNPTNKKIVIEISTDEIKRVNTANTFDEVVSELRLDFALGNYKTFTSTDTLIEELHS